MLLRKVHLPGKIDDGDATTTSPALPATISPTIRPSALFSMTTTNKDSRRTPLGHLSQYKNNKKSKRLLVGLSTLLLWRAFEQSHRDIGSVLSLRQTNGSGGMMGRNKNAKATTTIMDDYSNLTTSDEWNNWAVSIFDNYYYNKTYSQQQQQYLQSKSDDISKAYSLPLTTPTSAFLQLYFPTRIANFSSAYPTSNGNNINSTVSSTLLKDNSFFAFPKLAAWRKGYQRHAITTIQGHGKSATTNQDRSIVVNCCHDTKHNDSSPSFWWMGLMDGHGKYGHVLAQLAVLEIPKLLIRKLLSLALPSGENEVTTTNMTTELLSETFDELQHERLPRDIPTSGAVAVSILRYRDTLYVSHVGDASAMVVRCDSMITQGGTSDDTDNKSSTAVQPTILYDAKPHKPMDPIERDRITKAGGKPYFQNRRKNDTSTSRFQFGGIGDVGMSRSIGDFDAEPYGMSALPTTHMIDMSIDSRLRRECATTTTSCRYLAIATSDGISHVLAGKEEKTTGWLTHLCASSDLSLAVDQVVTKAAMLWDESYKGDYADDITLAVHELVL